MRRAKKKQKAPRTYGTRSLFHLPTGKWLMQYKPKWSPKPKSKTIEAANEKAASQQLNEWVKELDGQNGPNVGLSIGQVIRTASGRHANRRMRSAKRLGHREPHEEASGALLSKP